MKLLYFINIIFFIVLLLPAHVLAQPVLAVGFDNMNVMYFGVDNPITVAVENTNPRKVIVTADNASVTGANGKYIVSPTKPGLQNINISVMTPKGLKKIGTMQCRVKNLPNPVAYLLNKNKGFINKAELCAARAPIAQFTNGLCGMYLILSCNVYLTRNEDIYFEQHIESLFKDDISRFTGFDEATNASFQTARNGDVVALTDICDGA